MCSSDLRQTLRNFTSDPGKREVADGNHMRVAVAQSRVATAVAKCVELLNIAQRRAGLLRDPLAQAAVKGSVADWVKGPRRQRGKFALAPRMHG